MKIERTKCDNCGVERDNNTYGGYPMLTLHLRINAGIGLACLERKDFCNNICLRDFLLKLHPLETLPLETKIA